MSKFLDNYLSFLKNSISESQLENRIEITVPFFDRRGEPLNIYIEEENDDIYLTDDGYIIEDLLSCGCNIKMPTRTMLLQSIVKHHKIDISNNYELYAYTKSDSFDLKLHDLILCMIAVSNLYLTLRKNNAPIFLEDLKEYFNIE